MMLALCENIHKFAVSGDQMQERNAEECKDRIRVYPCISLYCGEHQHEHYATQRGALRCIVNQP